LIARRAVPRAARAGGAGANLEIGARGLVARNPGRHGAVVRRPALFDLAGAARPVFL